MILDNNIIKIIVTLGGILMKLTEKAAEVIKRILKDSGKDQSFIRFVVVSGGCSCSGQRYGLYVDDEKSNDDLVFESNGVKLIVDPMSYEEAKDVTIDYVKDEVFGEGFSISKENCCNGDCECKRK